MLNVLRRLLLAKKMNRLTKLATEIIYSEKVDLENCIRKLSRTGSDISLLYAYVAIQTATTLTGPIARDDIARALGQIRDLEVRLVREGADELKLIQRELAGMFWQRRVDAILEGKSACRVNEYSYKGMVYRFESAKKGPASDEEREGLRRLAQELCVAENELDAHLYERASQEAAEAAFLRIKEEVAAESRMREGDGPTQEDLDAEYEDLIAQLADINKRKKDEA